MSSSVGALEARGNNPFLLAILLCCFCVGQTILSNLKDTLVLVHHPYGASIIPSIQLWGLLPSALMFSWLFKQLTRRYSHRTVAIMILFLAIAFLLLYALWIFPYRNQLALYGLGRGLRDLLGESSRYLVSLVEYWPITIFYLFADLWAVMVISTIFWGLLNANSSIQGSQRWYGWIQLGGTAAPLVAGYLSNTLIVEQLRPGLLFGHDAWEQTLIQQVLLIVALTLLGIALLAKLIPDGGKATQSERDRGSLLVSLAHAIRDRYLRCLAIFVVGNAWVYLMADLVWKAELGQAYSDPNMLMRVMNYAQWLAGSCSIVAALLTPWLVSRFGWTCLAMISPVVLLAANAGLFGSVFFGEQIAALLPAAISMSPVTLIIIAGAVQNGLNKAVKFSVFDSSKEMALTALPAEERWSGKVAIDSTGTHVGKTATALSQSGLLLMLGTTTACIPLFAVSVFVVLWVWLGAARMLGKDYRELAAQEARDEVPIDLSLTPFCATREQT